MSRRLRRVRGHLSPAFLAVEGSASGEGDRARAELEEQGYTIQDQAVDATMLARLRTAARAMVAAAGRHQEHGFAMRSGSGKGAWGLRGIYDPSWGEISEIFREYMASAAVQSHVQRFLGCSHQQLLLPDADFLIFCNPPEGYAQQWHRDIRWYGSGGDFSETAQRKRWDEIQAGPNGSWRDGSPHVSGYNDYMVENGGAQLRWQLALVDMPDCGVDYVPGSHRRFRTQLEEAALMPSEQRATKVGCVDGAPPGIHDGHSPIPAHEGSPGSAVIPLKAGQAVFWNGDGIHRGVTRTGVERLTLSCGLVRWSGVKSKGQDPGRIDINGRPIVTTSRHHSIRDQLDPRLIWKLRPEVRQGLAQNADWLAQAWDRWCMTQKYSWADLIASGEATAARDVYAQ